MSTLGPISTLPAWDRLFSLDLNFEAGEIDPRLVTQRASPGTYVGADGMVKFSAANVPRIEYDYAAGRCLGLLKEEARTNLFNYSSDFVIAWWSRGGVTPVTGELAPDGSSTATRLVDTTVSSGHQVFRNVTMEGNKDIAFSCYVANAGRRFCQFSIGGAAGGNTVVPFDTLTGQVGVGAGAENAKVTKLANGWWRVCVFSRTIAAGGDVRFGVNMKLTLGGSVTYSGDGISGIKVWGAQAEIGAFETSLIHTAGAQATRANDFMHVPIGEWFSPSAGTLITESEYFGHSTGDPSVNGIANFNNESANLYLGISASTSNTRSTYYRVGWGSFMVGNSGDWPANRFVRVAATYADNSSVLVTAGSVVTNNLPLTNQLAGITQLSIGARHRTSQSLLNGHIKRIKYAPSVVPTADLQTLTRR